MRIILPACKWNSRTDDLDWNDFGRNCIRWAEDYERSLLPHDLVFPEPGQIWQAVRDCHVNFNAFFNGWPNNQPFMVFGDPFPAGSLPFGRALLSRGEQVRIEQMNETKPLMIWFKPVRYQELQSVIVPAEVQSTALYSCYCLSLKLVRNPRSLFRDPSSEYFSEAFQRVEKP